MKPSTQTHLDIYDIQNDLLILKDGSVCMLLEVSAINFGLFSEREQEATIYAYAQMLNSLNFTIQIVITSKRKDITDYLDRLEVRLSSTTSPKVKEQLLKYREFIKSIVRQGNVLDKKFYVSIPFSSLELGVSSALSAFSKKPIKPVAPMATIVERATNHLSPKRDHLIRLLARIGLKSRQMSSQELLQLFYDAYNASDLGTKVSIPTNP